MIAPFCHGVAGMEEYSCNATLVAPFCQAVAGATRFFATGVWCVPPFCHVWRMGAVFSKRLLISDCSRRLLGCERFVRRTNWPIE